MASFVQLRIILQQPRPDIQLFLEKLSANQLKKEDYDILLRKVVESKAPDFKKFCDALVRKGADVNFFDSKDNVSNLMLACQKGNAEMVNALLSFKDINIIHSDRRQLNAAFYAIQNRGKEESQNILRLLLQRESSLVNRQAANQTLLTAAIRKNKIEIVKLLLQFKANPNWQVPDTGNTALHDAVKQFKSKNSVAIRQIIKLLLLHGADVFKKNKQQKNVYDYAEKALDQFQNIERNVKQIKQKQQIKIDNLLIINTKEDLEQLFQTADSLFDKYEQVSYDQEPTFFEQDEVFDGLSEQISELQKKCIQQYENAKKQIQNWLLKFDKIISVMGYSAEIIGSFKTGLWIKHCNIDISLIKIDMEYSNVFFKEIIQQVFDQLKKSNICKSCNLLNRNNRIPIIKLQIQSKNNEKNRIISITMMDRNLNSRSISHFILEQKKICPILQPIFFTIKYLTYHYKLNDTKNGGLKTYALIIMLLSCIAKWNEANTGKLLVDFLYYFGFYYEYQYQFNINKIGNYQYQIGNDQDTDQYMLALHILDPINPNNNVGKHVKALQLQKMFKAAYITLHLYIPTGKRLETMFQSKNIILS